jgi:hypothetical protein
VEADHAEDDGYAAEGEDGYDTYFGPQGHLESPEGWNGEGEDIEIENDILFYWVSLGKSLSWSRDCTNVEGANKT